MISIRPIRSDDAEALGSFFARIPEQDRTFFREDVFDAAVRDAWLQNRSGRHLLGVDDDGVVCGAVAVACEVGWSSHVGELRLVVDPGLRRRGLGRDLARRGLLEAIDMGLSKIVVHTLAEDTATIALLNSLGFEGEALLRDHVEDRSGTRHDLIVLAHRVPEEWSVLTTVGIADELR